MIAPAKPPNADRLATRRIDLHAHTDRSDGADPPAVLLGRAAEAGLTHIALTDHDTTQGLLDLKPGDLPGGLTVVPSIELTVHLETLDDAEVHLLGPGVDPHDPVLLATTARLTEGRQARIGAMLKQLVAARLVTDDEGAALARQFRAVAAPGRLHLARGLVARGVTGNVRQAFRSYLHHGAPFHLPLQRYALADGVALVRQAGGVPVLAHPGLYKRLEEVVVAAVRAGVVGLELHHPSHDPPMREQLEALGRRLGVTLFTGGSDFHDAETYLGRRFGQLYTPEDMWERLAAEARVPEYLPPVD